MIGLWALTSYFLRFGLIHAISFLQLQLSLVSFSNLARRQHFPSIPVSMEDDVRSSQGNIPKQYGIFMCQRANLYTVNKMA